MLFPSVTFLFYFLPLFFVLYCAAPGITAKNIVLLVASLLFYAWGEPRFVLLLAGQIVLNYCFALAIGSADGSRRWIAVAIGVAANLALLGLFKYADFAVGTLNVLTGGDTFALPGLALPLGISFFTFHAISYLVDVYRGGVAANRNLLSVAVYIAMFPQLVAGPIIRYHTIARRLSERRTTLGRAAAGFRIFVIGLAQKVLIADEVARIAETVFDKVAQPSMGEAWLGLGAYTIQIYFDFAGYSNMAIGLALALGFAFPRNFNLPYAARSVTEFWRRWHISLSRWLRDYLYVPLGGNRGSRAATYRNLCLVFVACGLWHGANWTFVIWGIHHGAFLHRRAGGAWADVGASSRGRAVLRAARRDERLGLVSCARSRSCALVLRRAWCPPWRCGDKHRDTSRGPSGHPLRARHWRRARGRAHRPARRVAAHRATRGECRFRARGHGDGRARVRPIGPEHRGGLVQPIPLFPVLTMGLLARYRRFWGIAFLAALAVPMAIQSTRPIAQSSGDEARMLGPVPDRPRSLGRWLALPRELDRFLADHFGLRGELVRLHGRLRYAINLPNDLRVVVGRDNWLFLNSDGSIEQSTGKVLREVAITRFADHAAALRAHLAAKGAALVVAIPPNGSTVNRTRLPAWASETAAVTEYDLAMCALAARGVRAVDLRPALVAAAPGPTHRRTDTHWNKLGALLAYNAVVRAAGRDDWAIDVVRVLRGFERIEGGDLARLLAISADVTDEDAVIDLGSYGPPPPPVSAIATQFESGGDLVETGRAAPTVAVIGDSFTRGFWQDYFALHAGRYVWMHHELCGFRLSVLDEYAPALVILAPAERQMFCAGQN